MDMMREVRNVVWELWWQGIWCGTATGKRGPVVRHPQPPPILGQRRASGERACFSSSLSSAYRRGLDSSKREVTSL